MYQYEGSDWVQTKDGTYAIHGLIYVENLGSNKQVDLIYSTDGWQTVHTQPAQFAVMHAAPDQELWTFGLDVGTERLHVDYAIRYIVNGVEYWDNNFGRDYSK